MTIADQIRDTVANDGERQNDPCFQNLRDFYEAKKREGVVIKQEYTLPPMDTIGRTLVVELRRVEDIDK